jgi:UDP-N-acetylmuramoylalanine--D-glutamate ligase
MNTLIAGYGKTGQAVLDFLLKNCSGDTIFIYDDILDNKAISAIYINKDGIDAFLKSPDFFKIDRCIASPGIHKNHPIFLEMKRRIKPIYSEIEFAYEFLINNKNNAGIKMIAITGTNGKTTATSLCAAAMEKAGGNVFIGGNIGTPFISGVAEYDKFVLEISSFQLEYTYKFKPDIAVLLNVEDDHLDRYENFDEYRLTKYKLFKNQDFNDIAILNYDDYNSRILRGLVGSVPILFGYNENKCDVYYKNEAIYLRLKNICGSDYKVSLKNLKDKRNFLISDMMAASTALLIWGFSEEVVEASFNEYKLPPHRVEFLGSVGGVDFYDDSKATNPAAVISALECFSAKDKVVLILGGKDKGFNYDCLIEPVKKYAKACVLIGQTADNLNRTLKGAITLIRADDMGSAVKKAFEQAAGGGTVLFSPAASSFDMFKDYNERGEAFKKCFESLNHVLL